MPRCPFLLLVYVLLALLSQCGLGLAQLLVRNVAFHPRFLNDLKADEASTLQVEVAYYYNPALSRKLGDYNISLGALSGNPEIARLGYRSESLKWSTTSMIGGDDDDGDGDGDGDGAGVVVHAAAPLDLSDRRLAQLKLAFHRTNLTLDALFLGRTKGSFNLSITPAKILKGDEKPLKIELLGPVPEFPIVVKRSHWSRMMNAIFLSTLGILIIVANVMMGCELNLSVVGSVLRRPVAPAIGFVCQFVMMPLISYALARSLLVPYGELALGLGLFTAGCAPGGGASNFWTVLLDGNADLSISMTAISTLAAFAMMPFWMWALGGTFLPDVAIRIPYKNILISLSILVGPLLLGIAIKRFLPRVAELVRKVMRPFLIGILVFILSFGTYANLYMFRLMSWQVLLGGLLLPFCGFWLGCFAALMLRLPAADVAAIAIETGVQNSGIAIMLLKLSFPEPDGDIGSVVPVVVSIFTPGPLLLGYSIHVLMKFFKKEDGVCGDCADEAARGDEDEDGFKPLKNADSSLSACFKNQLNNNEEMNGVALTRDGEKDVNSVLLKPEEIGG